MNYEQKYNEVLQKAKEEYNRLGELGNESMKRRFEIIFPELRESEDERIRKRLVEYFNGFYDGFSSGNNVNVRWEGLEVKKVIAYLEKRKEQNPRIELIQRSWYMEGYTDGEFKREPMWNLVTGKGGPRYEKNEKYGQPLEQKPAEWSEEDELMRKRCIADLGYLTEYEPQYKERYDAQINWLKSLRPSWKPSEEQEEPEYYQHFDPDC